jgi:hypothetical protein
MFETRGWRGGEGGGCLLSGYVEDGGAGACMGRRSCVVPEAFCLLCFVFRLLRGGGERICGEPDEYLAVPDQVFRAMKFRLCEQGRVGESREVESMKVCVLTASCICVASPLQKRPKSEWRRRMALRRWACS